MQVFSYVALVGAVALAGGYLYFDYLTKRDALITASAQQTAQQTAQTQAVAGVVGGFLGSIVNAVGGLVSEQIGGAA